MSKVYDLQHPRIFSRFELHYEQKRHENYRLAQSKAKITTFTFWNNEKFGHFSHRNLPTDFHDFASFGDFFNPM